MPASAFTPDVVVEIAFGSGYATPAASRSWTDVSSYVEGQSLVTITRGRSDEFSDVTPSRLTVTLDNRDGRFTPGYASGANYPNVLKGTPIRVTATWSAVTYRRILAYVDEWPVSWPQATSGSSTVTVTASSRLARLGRGAELSSLLGEEYGADGPVMHYPLSEPAGSVAVSNISRTPQSQLTIGQIGTGGTVVFASGVGPADGLSAPVFNPASTDNGKYLRTTDILTSPGSGQRHVSLEAWLATSGSSAGEIVVLQSSTLIVQLYIGSTGIVTASASVNGAIGGRSASSAAGQNDGLTHHVVGLFDLDGAGSVTVTLMLDGATAGTDTGALSGGPTTFPAFAKMAVGGAFATTLPTPESSPFDGTLAQVAVYGGATAVSTARFAEHYLAGSVGFAGESSDARLVRIGGYAGVPSAEVSAEAGNTTSMSTQDTTGQSPVQALLDVVHTENGLLFDAGDGTLTFHARGHRYNATSVLTLDAATQQVEADLTPKLDDFGLVNDCTVTTPSGYSTRVVSAASVDANGIYRDDLTLLYTSDYEADDAANWRVASYATPQVRVPGISVHLTLQSSAQVTAVLAVELGSLVTISGLPTQAPASSMDFFVEGYTEVIGSEGQGWVWTANLSPQLETHSVFEIGHAVYGQYDAYGLAF